MKFNLRVIKSWMVKFASRKRTFEVFCRDSWLFDRWWVGLRVASGWSDGLKWVLRLNGLTWILRLNGLTRVLRLNGLTWVLRLDGLTWVLRLNGLTWVLRLDRLGRIGGLDWLTGNRTGAVLARNISGPIANLDLGIEDERSRTGQAVGVKIDALVKALAAFQVGKVASLLRTTKFLPLSR